MALSVFLWPSLTVDAQVPDITETDERPAISVIGRAFGGRVVLRWAPATPVAWSVARRNGYVVERRSFYDQQPGPDTVFVAITSEPIRTWPIERFELLGQEGGVLPLVVGQALHGERFQPTAQMTFVQAMLLEAEDLESRFNFSLLAADFDSVAAEALGTRLVDRDVVSGKTYEYRVSLAEPDSLVQVRPGIAYVTVEERETTRPADFGAEPGDGQLTLSWSGFTAGEEFTGYWLERSDDRGRIFRRLTQAPILAVDVGPGGSHSHTDTSLTNYHQYVYRLYGVTAFGTTSPPAIARGTPMDLTAPPAPLIRSSRHLHESSIRLTWEMPSSPDDLDGFYVGHSTFADGPFEVDIANRLSPETRQAVDARALSFELNYFVVASIDTASNIAYSLPVLVQLRDSIPPAPPADIRLVSINDTTGAIRIGWNPATELDLFGYRVFRAHDARDEFVLRTGDVIYDTTFVDTLNLQSLTRDVYYEVAALDYNYNTSERSERLRVRLPDLVPPVAPVFTAAVPTDSSVSLAWVRSSSDDVMLQLLYRRALTDDEWMRYDTLATGVDNYVDVEVRKRTVYEYSLQVIDSTGLASPLALPVKARPYDAGVRAGVASLTAVADTANKVVTVSWRYDPAADYDYWFVVYRRVGDGSLARYRSAGKNTSFEDRQAGWRQESRYEYAVQVFHRDGGVSPLSEPVVVIYPRRL